MSKLWQEAVNTGLTVAAFQVDYNENHPERSSL